MTKVLLIVHVLAAIIAIGPVAVAASMFPAAARRSPADVATLRLLHRICMVYALIGLAVPVFGFATASALHVMGSPWLIASIILTGLAAAVLALLVLPRQNAILALAGDSTMDQGLTSRLAMFTGIFNLLWATVTVLMIVRPGSTTGV